MRAYRKFVSAFIVLVLLFQLNVLGVPAFAAGTPGIGISVSPLDGTEGSDVDVVLYLTGDVASDPIRGVQIDIGNVDSAVWTVGEASSLVEDASALSNTVTFHEDQGLVRFLYVAAFGNTMPASTEDLLAINMSLKRDLLPDESFVLPVNIKIQSASGNKTVLSEQCVISQGAPEVVVAKTSLVFDGLIRIKYYFDIPRALYRSEGCCFAFFVDGQEILRTPFSDGVSSSDGISYYFSVVPKDFEKNVTVKAIGADGTSLRFVGRGGKDYTESGYSFSPKLYANIMKLHGSVPSMRDLAKAFDRYGNAAKLYFGESAAASDGLEDLPLDELNSYTISTEGTKPTGLSDTAISVMFESDNAVRIYYLCDESHTPQAYSFKIDGQPAQLRERSDGAFYLTVPNIAAKDLDKTHSFTVSDGENDYTVNASVLAYANMLAQSGDESACALGYALYHYNSAAKAFFEA